MGVSIRDTFQLFLFDSYGAILFFSLIGKKRDFFRYPPFDLSVGSASSSSSTFHKTAASSRCCRWFFFWWWRPSLQETSRGHHFFFLSTKGEAIFNKRQVPSTYFITRRSIFFFRQDGWRINHYWQGTGRRDRERERAEIKRRREGGAAAILTYYIRVPRHGQKERVWKWCVPNSGWRCFVGILGKLLPHNYNSSNLIKNFH